jgi:DivIVA domain-containing protein
VDRAAIERRDFPVGRRGYERAAVDAHLRRVADELDALRARSPSPIAAEASDHVRAILDAAETSAAALSADAGAHAARVADAADGMLARLRELEGELGAVVAALRRSAERLDEGLARLREQAGETDTRVGGSDAPVGGSDAPVGEPPPLEEDFAAAATADTDVAATPNGDEAGARLIALNMALSGTPRDETARYLADNYALADRDGLLDDVYARAGR